MRTNKVGKALYALPHLLSYIAWQHPSSFLYSQSTYSGQRSKYHFHNAQSQGKIKGSRSVIESGDQGIFVTCDRGREMKCIYEMSDLLSEVLDRLLDHRKRSLTGSQYCKDHDTTTASAAYASEDEEDVPRAGFDIETSVEKEISDMKPSSSTVEKPFSYVKLSTDCRMSLNP